jgi:hypothetical protein
MISKKGVELSINFLVIIIISLAVLGMAGVFFTKFMKGATKIQADYDQQTEQELENLLSSGQKVAIPFTRKEVNPGDPGVFGIGVLNVAGSNKNFHILIQCSSTSGPPCLSDTIVRTPLLINNNEHTKTPIVIPTDKTTPTGTYVFNVCVCPDNPCGDCNAGTLNLYDGSIHKIYLKVV